MLLSEAFQQYDAILSSQGKSLKTRNNYRSGLANLIKHSADVPVELITFGTITRWQLEMQRTGHQQSTIKTNLGYIREVLKYLRKEGYPVIDSRDIDLPKIAQKPPVWLDYREVQQILDVIDSARDKALIACLFATGARITELLQLNIDSIKDGAATIVGKGSKVGVLYFDSTALNYLQEYLQSRKDSLTPLFVSGQYRRITVSRVEQLLHIYTDMAGIEKNVTPHVLRHSFASDLILNGADIYSTSRLLRHSNITTTQIYTHVKEEQNQDAYTKYHSARKSIAR